MGNGVCFVGLCPNVLLMEEGYLVGGMHVVILRQLHSLGVIRVPTEYRESEAW